MFSPFHHPQLFALPFVKLAIMFSHCTFFQRHFNFCTAGMINSTSLESPVLAVLGAAGMQGHDGPARRKCIIHGKVL